MIKIIVLVLLISSFSGCTALFDERDSAIEAIEEFFGRDRIADDPVPMSPSENPEPLEPGSIYEGTNLSYNLLSVIPDAVNSLLHLDMEVLNKGEDTIYFDASRMLRIADTGDNSVTPASDNPHHLMGILQPQCRISGRVSFPMPAMTDNTVLLLIADESKTLRPVFQVTKGDFHSDFDRVFDNGTLRSAYSIGAPVISDLLTISLEEVTYDADHTEALCRVTVINNSDSQALFLTGYNILSAHDMEGNVLAIDSKSVTVPKVIEANSRVSGTLAVITPSGPQDFYLTVMPDENRLDDRYIIFAH